MGMTLPDLPKGKRGMGWKDAALYLKRNGPSTVAQICGTEERRITHALTAVLRLNPTIFVQVQRLGHTQGSGRGWVVWTLKDGA